MGPKINILFLMFFDGLNIRYWTQLTPKNKKSIVIKT